MTQFPRRHILKLAGTIGAVQMGALPSLASASSGTESGWIQEAKLVADDGDSSDAFGQSVALDGNTALIGASWDEDPNGSESGSAYVFTRSDSSWTQRTKLIAEDGDDYDRFGHSVALDGDTAVIGARDDGSAYVFTETDGAWTQQTKLTADDADDWGAFSRSVGLDGDTALIGAPRDENLNGEYAGAAYVFKQSAEEWAQQAKLIAEDGDDKDRFGYSVALDGDTAIIGALLDEDPNGYFSGSAYVFTETDGAWTQQAKLSADDGDDEDRFGHSVALDGDTAIIGAEGDEDPNGDSAGSAYVFTRSGGDWVQDTKLAAADGDSEDLFGYSVALDVATAVIGSRGDEDPNGSGAGSAYIFTQSNGAWTQQTKLTADDGEGGDKFGYSATVDRGTAIIGARDSDPLGYFSGSAYVYSQRQFEVEIDIKPGSDSNPIYPADDTLIPVAILNTDDFAPSEIDVSTLRFGAVDEVDQGGGATPAHDGHVEDVDDDGDDDLVVHFPSQDTGFESDDTTGKLVGQTVHDLHIYGTDNVTVVDTS